METYDAILKRRSIRSYDEAKHVSDNDLDLILKAGMAAPSALNKQPWEFYIIKNKDLQNKIKNIHEYYDRNSDLLIIICANRINQSKDSILDYWVEDCSAAMENMMIEATSLGLGSLWCGIYPKMDRVKEIKELLKLDDLIIPFGILHLGYSKDDPKSMTYYNKDKIHII